MLSRIIASVGEIVEQDADVQWIVAELPTGERRQAVNYVRISGRVAAGQSVLLNETARLLGLGTGGFDFVVANLSDPAGESEGIGGGHIVKGRYLPQQQAVLTLEESPEYTDVWDRRLEAMPVIAGQLHSQIAPAAAGLALMGISPVLYIMTDGAALPLPFSRLVSRLKIAGLIHRVITAGQAFGGDGETVTLHSALIAAKHIFGARAVIVCQGPGNAGTGTRYGFSGIEQAACLDAAQKLGGTPFAIVRLSGADPRERHVGVSHHTRTSLELTHASCRVALPRGSRFPGLARRHRRVFVDRSDEAVALLKDREVDVTTMGRTPEEDPLFFCAAAAAGIAAAEACHLNGRAGIE